MTKPRDPDALLSAYLAVGMEVLPDRVVDAVLDEVHRTRQRVVFGPWRTRPTFRSPLGAAAVVAVVVLAGAFLLVQGGRPVVTTPSPTAPASFGASQPAVAGSPTPAPTSSSEVSPPPVGQSLELTWTKVALDQRSPQVAWLGDRFVLVDEDSGGTFTSTDGFSWRAPQPGEDPGYFDLLRGSFASWQTDVVAWWNPEDGPDYTNKPSVTARDVVRIVRPPAAPTETTPFKGRIESMAIGPAGIVAQVHSHLDWDAWVTKKLGARSNNAWVKHLKSVDFRDGILEIKLDNGPGLKVVWADEGFEPGDYQDAGFGWYSPDGEQWTLMPSEVPSQDGDGTRGFLTGFGDVVGVSDGFIARGVDTECSSDEGCAGMWYSPDGVTWRNIGNVVNGSDGLVLPWMGGALVTDGVGRFDFWTSQGHIELAMAAAIRAEWKQPTAGFGAGPLGLVTVLKDDKEILVTRDGVDWDIQPTPAEMAADQTLFYDAPIVAVGDRSVLVVMWSGSHEARIPSLWLGTLEP
jgi:hypothetical protein